MAGNKGHNRQYSSNARQQGLQLLLLLAVHLCLCPRSCLASRKMGLGIHSATVGASDFSRHDEEHTQQMAGLEAKLDLLEAEAAAKAAAAAAKAAVPQQVQAAKPAQARAATAAAVSSTGDKAAGAAAAVPGETCTGAACTYDLDSIPDLPTLLWRHQQYQTAVLMGSSTAAPTRVPAVLVNSNDLVGLGNRVPAVVTGFVLALLTKRLFLLNSTFQRFMGLPFPGDWQDYQSHFNGTNCNIQLDRLASRDLGFCEDLYEQRTGTRTADIMRLQSPDYDLPMLQINPAVDRYFKKFFPTGEVFHPVVQHLLHPKAELDAAMQPYLPDAKRCLVGMHIRTRKYAGVRVKQFTSMARMLAQGKEGNVFVASDASLFPYVQRGLPNRRVWWSTLTSSALASAERTRGANPGSELSAVLDMFLLSKCKHIILTPASSLGAVAAGYAGVPPVFANFGKHSDPFLNPWFWHSTTTEPCFFKAASMHVSTDPLSTRFRDKHPMYLYHNQCHYQQHLRAMPAFLKLSTNDTSYIHTLLT